MELHTLPKLPTRPLHQQQEQRQNELEERRKEQSIKNQRKQGVSTNQSKNATPAVAASLPSLPLRPPPPPPLPMGANGNYNEWQGASNLYCGFIGTAADNVDPQVKNSNVPEKTSSSSPSPASKKAITPPPLPSLPGMISGPPGISPDFMYCGFIAPPDSTANSTANKRDRLETVATEATGSLSSRSSYEGSSVLSEDENDVSNVPQHSSVVEVKSKLYVSGICCTTEVPIVRRIVRPIPGVSRVDIHLISKHVTVHHCPNTVTVMQLAQTLEDQGFPTKIVHDGTNNRSNDNVTYDENNVVPMERSKFVVSTLSVNHEWNRQNVQHLVETLRHDYSCNHKVRSIDPNPISKTIKIEHDPEIVSITDIVMSLTQKCKIPVSVAVDGAKCNLYMPKDERDLQGGDSTSSDGRAAGWIKENILGCNVAMSGIFWILSLPSHFEVLESFKYFGLVSVAFGLPPIWKKAVRALRRVQFDANCMMTTAAVGAMCLQQYDEAASVAFLFSISELLERQASRKAREALKDICDMKPEYANVIDPVTKELMVVPAERVALGSHISVKTGDKIATDGIIVEGDSLVDESSLTGESIPVPKAKGDKVKGGTINIGKTQLVVRTTATVEDSAVSRLIQLVEDAQSNRSETEKLIDSFARTYTPTVMIIAVLTATLPLVMGLDNRYQWLLNGLIIIVIACPCALTISTPVTYAAGLAATAQKGIVVKGGAKLEAMGSVEKVVFDKTGTLTTGVFSLVHFDLISTTKTRHELLALLALIEGRSSHPVATCLVQAAKDENAHIPRDFTMSNHTLLKGEGVSANVGGTTVYVGNQRLFARLNLLDSLSESQKRKTEAWDSSGSMIGFIGTEEEGISAAFCVKDAIRQEAKSVVEELRYAGIESMLCTGDSNAVANAVANEVGVAQECIRSQMLPEEKYKYVESLKKPSKHGCALWQDQQYVLFCGDGVNDAPALATADIGCALGEGAAMAMVTSDITLMDSNLSKITETIAIGKKVQQTIKENIVLSLLAKLVVVVLTFNGEMTLLLAVASDVGIMLLVTLNGMKVLSSAQEIPLHALAETQKRQKLTEMKPLVGNVDAADEIV